MNKILFFDIDGTLFNTAKFIKDFQFEVITQFDVPEISDINFADISQEVKKEHGLFIPSIFLDKVCSISSKINRQKLDNLFWSKEIISRNLFKDCSVIAQISNNATIGIFSKGDVGWQKEKIQSFQEYINDRYIYIFPNKITSIKLAFEKHSDSDIFLVDNDLEVLKTVMSGYPSVKCFLIDREGNLEDNVGIIKIKSLEELGTLI